MYSSNFDCSSFSVVLVVLLLLCALVRRIVLCSISVVENSLSFISIDSGYVYIWKNLLGDPKIVKSILNYVEKTKRFNFE